MALPLLFMTAALAADEPSPFDGIPDLHFQYYDIEGRTPAEIYASMRARAPNLDDGVARTAWYIRTGWRETRRGSACAIDDPETSLSITITLPRLVTREPTREGWDFWRRNLLGLEIHEAGHARIAYEHRNDFIDAAADATCGTVKAVALRSQQQIERIQEDYDRETRHGIDQVPLPGR